VLPDLLVLGLRQFRGFVQEVSADLQLADVVQQRGRAHVLDVRQRQAHFRRDAGGVHGHAVAWFSV